MTTAPITSESKYQAEAGWAKIPHGIWLREATSVAVDDQDRVYVFNRGNVPMLTFDSDGNCFGNAVIFINRIDPPIIKYDIGRQIIFRGPTTVKKEYRKNYDYRCQALHTSLRTICLYDCIII